MDLSLWPFFLWLFNFMHRNVRHFVLFFKFWFYIKNGFPAILTSYWPSTQNDNKTRMKLLQPFCSSKLKFKMAAIFGDILFNAQRFLLDFCVLQSRLNFFWMSPSEPRWALLSPNIFKMLPVSSFKYQRALLRKWVFDTLNVQWTPMSPFLTKKLTIADFCTENCWATVSSEDFH